MTTKVDEQEPERNARSIALHEVLAGADKLAQSRRRKDRELARLIRAAVVPEQRGEAVRRVSVDVLARAAEKLEVEASGRFSRPAGVRWAVLTCRSAYLAGRSESDACSRERVFRWLLRNHEIDHALFSPDDVSALCAAMTTRRVSWRLVVPIFRSVSLRAGRRLDGFATQETLRKMWEAELDEMQRFALEHADLAEKRK